MTTNMNTGKNISFYEISSTKTLKNRKPQGSIKLQYRTLRFNLPKYRTENSLKPRYRKSLWRSLCLIAICSRTIVPWNNRLLKRLSPGTYSFLRVSREECLISRDESLVSGDATVVSIYENRVLREGGDLLLSVAVRVNECSKGNFVERIFRNLWNWLFKSDVLFSPL